MLPKVIIGNMSVRENIVVIADEDYFAADAAQKLSLILAAEDHILGLIEGKNTLSVE